MSEFKEFLQEQLKDPELKAEYDALEPEFAIIRAMIDALNEHLATRSSDEDCDESDEVADDAPVDPRWAELKKLIK